MERGMTWIAVSAFVAAASLIIGVWGGDGMMIGLSILAVCMLIVCILFRNSTMYRYSLVASAVLLISTILMVSAFSYGTLVEDNGMSKNGWLLLSGFIQGMAIIPLIMLFYFTIAAVYDIRFNWAIVSGFSWLIGVGMMVPGYVFVYVFEQAGIDAGTVTNSDIVIKMIISLIMVAVFAIFLCMYFKKNRYMLTADGIEVMA